MMTTNSTMPHPNDSPDPIDSDQNSEPVPNDFLFWSLLIPVLLGCLGIVIALYFVRQNNGNHPQKIPKSDFRSIPPELMGYRQTSMLVCPIEGTPQCFAVQNDSTFIIGTAHPHTLYFFEEKGTQIRKIDLQEEPKAMVCGTAETIFTNKIVIAHPAKIAIYDDKGQFEENFHVWLYDEVQKQPRVVTGHSQFDIFDIPDERKTYDTNAKTEIYSLVLTGDSLFAADSGNRWVHRINDDNKSNTPIGYTLDAHGMLTESSPEYISTDNVSDFEGFVVYASPITMTYSRKNDLLYISNPGKHRIEVFTQEGLHKPELCWGEPSGDVHGFAGCCNPIELAALDDGRILTVEKAVSRIKIFNADRKLDCVVAGASILEDTPPELGRKPGKPGGRYFSAVPLSKGRIAVFDLDYAVLRFFEPLETH